MKARILIVEDESIVQLDMQSKLQRLGYTVAGSAVSGEEAIIKSAELKPDLILMDVRLEGPMDGVEAAAQIRAAREIPVLFLTAYQPSGEQQAAMHPFLGKPFRAEELRAAIARALDGRESNRSSQEAQRESE